MSEETNNEETEAAKAPEAGNDSAAASADSAASGGDSAAGGTDSAAGDMATAAQDANAEAQGEDTPVQPAPPQIPVEPVIDAQGRSYATGRRKDASARVWVKRGSGHVKINGKDVRDYFARPVLQMILAQPFEAAERVGEFDVIATVKGGGLSGQAGAVRHGISRALTYYEPGLRPALKKGGFLTRDPRVVERKKYGKAKARRSFQFSKR